MCFQRNQTSMAGKPWEYEAELAFKAGLIDIEILRLHNVYGSPSELDPSFSQVIPAECRKTIEQRI